MDLSHLAVLVVQDFQIDQHLQLDQLVQLALLDLLHPVVLCCPEVPYHQWHLNRTKYKLIKPKTHTLYFHIVTKYTELYDNRIQE